MTNINPDCLFCKIVAGEIPCHKLYEDDLVLAFLDIGPLSRGHCLVIPKEHAETLDALSDEAAAACGRIMPRLARAVMAATGVDDYNVLQNNGEPAHQVIKHVHFHIIPRTANAGLGITWPAGKLEQDEAQTLKQAIVERLV